MQSICVTYVNFLEFSYIWFWLQVFRQFIIFVSYLTVPRYCTPPAYIFVTSFNCEPLISDMILDPCIFKVLYQGGNYNQLVYSRSSIALEKSLKWFIFQTTITSLEIPVPGSKINFHFWIKKILQNTTRRSIS